MRQPKSAERSDPLSLPDASERLYRAIEQSADSILITNHEGVIEYVNPAFESMTGYSRAEAVGATPRILRSGVQSQRFYESMWASILSGQTFRAVMTNRRRNGEFYEEDQTISPIRDANGTVTHFVSTGRDITQRKRMQEAVQRVNQQLERECARVAGVLHDEAGQFLAVAHLTLSAVMSDVSPALAEQLTMVRAHLTQLEERLRQISHEMHPRVVEDLGLAEAVHFFCENFSRRTGILATVHSSLNSRWPAPIETVLYRMVQEGLTNIAKHARASRAIVKLEEQPAAVVCTIEDDGVGIEWKGAVSARGGLGLRLMRDRIEGLGGTLSIRAARDRGTELRAQVPMEV
jgi:PAS domain S-box-containing protein